MILFTENSPLRSAGLSAMVMLMLIHSVQSASAQHAPHHATVLEFGDADTLFIADSDVGRIYAYQLPAVEKQNKSQPFNVLGFSTKVAAHYGVHRSDLTFHDIATRPGSKQAFVSLTIRKDGKAFPAIITADQGGRIQSVDFNGLKHSHVDLADKPDDGVTFWRDIPASEFTVTDLDYVNGNLYVSGLSNGEFASTLRRFAYPFKAGSAAAASIEIYHAVHDQTETRAPIRAMTVLNLGGEETVVAAYTCTPLVTLPTRSLTDGAKVKGKTVAELGYGNTPLDVVQFSAMNMKGETEDFVLVVNRERSADLINVKDLEAANAKEGLTTPAQAWGHAGVNSRLLPLGAVMQADDQDAQFLVALKRNLDTGAVDLVSFRKGAYLRLSNFVTEYNFKDYQYADPKQEGLRGFQNMLKADEGYSDMAREAVGK